MKYEGEIYSNTLKFLDDIDNKQQDYIYEMDDKIRYGKNLWHKLWNKLKINNGFWKHPCFITQKNEFFSSIDYGYEMYKKNIFASYKIMKYEIFNGAKPFIKYSIKEPNIAIVIFFFFFVIHTL